jgi:acylphosphatase
MKSIAYSKCKIGPWRIFFLGVLGVLAVRPEPAEGFVSHFFLSSVNFSYWVSTGVRYNTLMHASIAKDGMHRRLCHFRGKVQGVGFRYTVKNLAMQFNVRGYVKNLPDGRVELVMEGPDQEMESLVSEVGRKMGCFINGLDQLVVPATGEFDYFFIRH